MIEALLRKTKLQREELYQSFSKKNKTFSKKIKIEILFNQFNSLSFLSFSCVVIYLILTISLILYVLKY